MYLETEEEETGFPKLQFIWGACGSRRTGLLDARLEPLSFPGVFWGWKTHLSMVQTTSERSCSIPVGFKWGWKGLGASCSEEMWLLSCTSIMQEFGADLGKGISHPRSLVGFAELKPGWVESTSWMRLCQPQKPALRCWFCWSGSCQSCLYLANCKSLSSAHGKLVDSSISWDIDRAGSFLTVRVSWFRWMWSCDVLHKHLIFQLYNLWLHH